MNKQVSLLSRIPSSKRYYSQMGYQFDIRDELWKLDGSITINLSRLTILEPVTREGFRLTLCRYAQELSASHNARLLGLLVSYYQASNENTISISGLSSWKIKLGPGKEDSLAAFRTFLHSWYSWGYPGITEDAANYLYSFRLKGGIKGKPVKNACPYSGPFSTCEQSALLEWASNSFAQKIISLTQFAMLMTLSFTGRRMVQIRSLRGGDLSTSNQNTVIEFYVNFPRVKQRGYGFRETFKQITIVSELYLVLVNQFNESLKYIENYYNEKIPDDIRIHIPIFINKDVLMVHDCLSDLFLKMKEIPDYLHITKKNVAFEFRQLQGKCMARSERTGEIIKISPSRFRYTKGTNLSRRGVQGVALAEALDHSDTQHISVYVQNTVETAYIIDETMASSLAPLAQAFAGQLIQSEREALRSADPHSRVKNTIGTNIGSCGSHSFCASGYRSCYTCINFQPWQDAPHEKVRSEILAERERQQVAGVSENVIRSTDRLLLAVEQVIQMCKQVHAGEEHE